jgi:hypothetical protein
MTVTGPVVPRRYQLTGVASPTPPVDEFPIGEILTCTKTGRMWITSNVGGSATPIGIASEFAFTNDPDIFTVGETLSGLKQYLEGVAPLQASGVQAYGPWKFTNSVKVEGSFQVTGGSSSFTSGSFAGTTFSVNTSATNANDVNIFGQDILIGTPTNAAGISSSKYMMSMTELGFKFLDFSTSSAGTARTIIDSTQLTTLAPFTAPSAKLTGLPSAGFLATDASGNVVAGTSGVAPVNATYLTISSNATLTNERTLAVGNHVTLVDGGANSTAALDWRYNPSKLSIIESECNSSGNLTISNANTGSVTYGSTGSGAYQSLATFTTSANLAGRASLGSSTISSVVFGSGNMVFTTYVRLTQLSVTGQAFWIRAGFYDSLDSTVADGCWFEYTDTANSGKWTCEAKAASAGLGQIDSGITVAANTWYKLTISVNAAGTRADFFINDTNVHQATSNIPSGTPQSTGFGVTLRKLSGTTAVTAQSDYIGLTLEMTR